MPWASSSPARRLREPSATTVATRSPAPARPANVSARPPRSRASALTSANTFPAAAPATFGPTVEAVVSAERELRGPEHADGVGQLDARKVGLVPALAGERLRLLVRPAREVDLEPGPGEAYGEARPPRARADDRGPADRGEAAEPLPL